MSFRLDKYLPERTERWLETLVITAIILALGYFFNRSDPFFIKADFPWVLFAPLLIALRYGIAPGMVSIAIICILYLSMFRMGLLSGEFPTVFMLGGVLMTMICGQFNAVWSVRLRRSDQLSRHASERFEQLSRAYFMVRLSHDRLEQNLISRPVTLRDAMVELGAVLASHGGALNKETSLALISILVHYCSLESAAIYLMGNNGNMQENPVADCGRGAPFKADDLLLRSAIETGSASYQSINHLAKGDGSPYLVAAPLRTSAGVIKGILLVSEMPFLALHRETLQIVGVLLAYATDHTEAAYESRKLLAVFTDCPAMFAAELYKMVRLRRELDVASALVVVNILPTARLQDLCVALERQQRGLDHGWRRNLGWGVQFVTLMPFSGAAAVEGYKGRLNEMLGRDFGAKIDEGGISSRSFMVAADDPLNQLADLLVGVTAA
ncbi:MAG: PelD GGDEF domain-containing protein [Desulfuromonadaceae bacterium]